MAKPIAVHKNNNPEINDLSKICKQQLLKHFSASSKMNHKNKHPGILFEEIQHNTDMRITTLSP